MKNFNTNYFWRTFFTYALLCLAGTSLTAAVQMAAVYQHEKADNSAQLKEQGQVLAAALLVPLELVDSATINRVAATVTSQTNLRVTVIDAAGVVLADTLESPSLMENHLFRPEIQQAIARDDTGEATRYSQTLQRNFNYLAVVVRDKSGDNNKVLGVVRVARDMALLELHLKESLYRVASVSIFILSMLLLLSVWIALSKTATIELLTETTEAISRGDFERRVPESRALGMKRLADAINQMARHSAKRLTTLTADRNRLATIFTGMVEGVVDVDENQKVLHINEAAAELLGLSTERSIGKPVWQEIRNQKMTMALDEAVKTRSVIRTQVDFQRVKDELVIDLYVASLADDQGKPIGAILVLHDVTGLKNLERIRTDFVANASHELKTPITAIRGLSETVVRDDDVDRETLMRFMERIHAQSIRLSQLVGDLMTISRLEADHGTSNFTRLNFNDLMTRALNAATPSLEHKKQSLEQSLPDTKLEVFGDHQNLSQLVDNLIDNAIKYTPEGGQIKIRLHRENNDLVLEVEDTGIGISPQYQERVFERFYRVDKARSQSLGGTGLGLSIVRNIAERHDGSVDVSSQLGRGSVFTFKMPLVSGAGQ